MAFLAALPGILTSISGGPGNIIKSIGATVSSIIDGVKEGKSFGDIIGTSLSKGVKQLTGIADEKEQAENTEILEKEHRKYEIIKNAPLFTNTRSATRQLVSPLITNTKSAALQTSRIKKEKIPSEYKSKYYPYNKSGLSDKALRLLLANQVISKKQLKDTSFDISEQYDDEEYERPMRKKKLAKKTVTKKTRR